VRIAICRDTKASNLICCQQYLRCEATGESYSAQASELIRLICLVLGDSALHALLGMALVDLLKTSGFQVTINVLLLPQIAAEADRAKETVGIFECSQTILL
jgi:hypothetical protein